MATRKDSIAAKIADFYKIEQTEAVGLIQYHKDIRDSLNRLGSVAAVSQGVELRGGIASEVSGVGKEIISAALPTIGGLIGYGVDRATKAIERAWKENKLDSVSTLGGSTSDQSEWSQFTKELASELVERKFQELKNLDQSQAKKLAQKDSEKIIDAITSGKFKGITIEDDETISKIANSVSAERPSASPNKPSLAASLATPIHIH